MTRAILLAVPIVFWMSGVAVAQWSVAAFTGNASTARGDLRVTSSGDDTAVTLQAVSYDDESFQSPIYYGGRVTRFFRAVPCLGLEGEFVHLKTITRPDAVVQADGRLAGQTVTGPRPLGTVLPRFELSHGLNLILANVVVRFPTRKADAPGGGPRLAMTGRGGVGPTVPHVEARFQNQDEDGYHVGRAAWHAAIGIEVRLWGRLHAVSEVKWTTTRQRLQAAGAGIDGRFRTRHLIAGLSWDLQPTVRSSSIHP